MKKGFLIFIFSILFTVSSFAEVYLNMGIPLSLAGGEADSKDLDATFDMFVFNIGFEPSILYATDNGFTVGLDSTIITRTYTSYTKNVSGVEAKYELDGYSFTIAPVIGYTGGPRGYVDSWQILFYPFVYENSRYHHYSLKIDGHTMISEDENVSAERYKTGVRFYLNWDDRKFNNVKYGFFMGMNVLYGGNGLDGLLDDDFAVEYSIGYNLMFVFDSSSSRHKGRGNHSPSRRFY